MGDGAGSVVSGGETGYCEESKAFFVSPDLVFKILWRSPQLLVVPLSLVQLSFISGVTHGLFWVLHSEVHVIRSHRK